MSEIDRLRSQFDIQPPDYMIFQPGSGGEEIGGMILNYYLLNSGRYTLNLGGVSGAGDVVDAFHIHECKYLIGLFNMEMAKEDLRRYVNEVMAGCPGANLILSGFWVYQAEISDTSNISILPDLNAILSFLDQKKAVVL